ncbi:CD74 molecule, major histocompatibility complex, class II invariant chain a [Genypterus blacodes]|uniref:CD74 molecule, major histocompatibility complex, class II invariant chain a n=1 Tax=Genypterus blacodes TaxID=154954 RepID=UPI003F758C9D
MDTQNPDAAPRSRAESQEPLVGVAAPAGSSNRRAFKVAGLTTLACLLVASQVFTAYMVVSQKQQIHTLQKSAEQMTKEIGRTSRVAPMKMHLSSLPLLMDSLLDEDPKTPRAPKLEKPVVVTVEQQLIDLLGNSQLPRFNQTFLDNLLDLESQMEATEWKSFSTWMRYWLIFQMAQEKPSAPPTTLPAFLIKTKCQVERERTPSGLLGAFKPQCDVDGSYQPIQCLHSTGNCWCVDKDGKRIPGTVTRGRPECPKGEVTAFRRMAVAPGLMAAVKND